MYNEKLKKQTHEKTNELEKDGTEESIDQIIIEAEEKLKRITKEVEGKMESDRTKTVEQSVNQIIKHAEVKLEEIMENAEKIVEQSMNKAGKNLGLINNAEQISRKNQTNINNN